MKSFWGNILRLNKASGKTSDVDGHTHGYNVDENGNGKTTVVDDHDHSISNWTVAQADGHSHTIQKEGE